MKRLSVLCCLSLLMLGTTATAATKMTKAQAIQRAADFCRQIGTPVSGDAVAEYPAPPSSTLLPDYYWQPRWLVSFPGQAQVEVVDATSVVSEYYSIAVSHQLDFDNRPAGQAIAQAEAVKRATDVINATGVKDELGPPEAREAQISLPPKAGAHSWIITWQRQFQGIPYRYDQAAVIMAAETGQIERAGLTFRSIPPAFQSIKPLQVLNRDRSEKAARAFLARLGVNPPDLYLGEMQLVRPNKYWQVGRSHTELNVPARPAWALLFKLDERRGCWVWIDTQTGNVLGGEGAGTFEPPIAANPPQPARK